MIFYWISTPTPPTLIPGPELHVTLLFMFYDTLSFKIWMANISQIKLFSSVCISLDFLVIFYRNFDVPSSFSSPTPFMFYVLNTTYNFCHYFINSNQAWSLIIIISNNLPTFYPLFLQFYFQLLFSRQGSEDVTHHYSEQWNILNPELEWMLKLQSHDSIHSFFFILNTSNQNKIRFRSSS